MMPGMDPKQMQKLMKQMGIKSDDIAATKVTIELKDGGRLVIFEPSVVQIEMQGEKSFQIGGKVHEEKDAGEDAGQQVLGHVAEQPGFPGGHGRVSAPSSAARSRVDLTAWPLMARS